MKVIYIASMSHSGSTLLDVLLNAHSRIASVGELKLLWAQLNRLERRQRTSFRCTCGAQHLRDCPFWSAVEHRLEADNGITLADIRTDAQGVRENLKGNRLLLETISAVSGREFIVDSSKDLGRLLALRDSGIDVFVVFLSREPKGQICSSLRKRRRGTAEHIVAYNGQTLRAVKTLSDIPHTFIRYEDLARLPGATLAMLLAKFGLAFEPSQLEWTSSPGHSWAGNRMRRRKDSTIQLDEKWRDKLTLVQKVSIDIGTLPARLVLATHRGRG